MSRLFAVMAAFLLGISPAFAEGIETTQKQATNPIAIGMFIAFVLVTLGIT